MKYSEEDIKGIIDIVESKLSAEDQKFINVLKNWAYDKSLINLINQWAVQLNYEARIIEKNKSKQDVKSLTQEKERFNKILKKIDEINKKKIQKLY